MTPRAYKVRATIRTCGVTFPKEQIVYHVANDYGLADDSTSVCRDTVFVSISVNECGTPFYVVPLQCLEVTELPAKTAPKNVRSWFKWPKLNRERECAINQAWALVAGYLFGMSHKDRWLSLAFVFYFLLIVSHWILLLFRDRLAEKLDQISRPRA